MDAPNRTNEIGLLSALDDRSPSVRHAIPWIVFAILLIVAPLGFGGGVGLTILTQMGIAIVACLSYNMLLGQSGMLSFGHAVYSGTGAFLAIHTLKLVSQGLAPVPVFAVPVVGGVAALVLAIAFGYPTTKKSGTPFAMITLGIGELVWASALMFPEFFGGEGGVSADRVSAARAFGPETLVGITYGSQIELYYLIAAYTFVCTAAMYAFTRTPLGRIANAVRDNAERVAFIGYDPKSVRYLAFIMSAFFAGIAGGLTALTFEIVTAEAVSAQRSGAYLLFTFIGGTMSFAGPIIGGILMVLAFVLLSEFTRAWLLYLGIAFVSVVLWAPGGVASVASSYLRLASIRRIKDALPIYLALTLGAAMAFIGSTSLVEMTYHLSLEGVMGPEMRLYGLSIDASDMSNWLISTSLLISGFSVFIPALRVLEDREQAMHQKIKDRAFERDDS